MKKEYVGAAKRGDRYLKLLANNQFIKDRDKFREKYDIPKEGIRYKDNSVESINHRKLITSQFFYTYKDAISKIMHKYNFAENERKDLISLLLFSTYRHNPLGFDILKENFPIAYLGNVDAQKNIIVGKKRIFIIPFGNTRPRDIKNHFNKELKKLLPDLVKNKDPFSVSIIKGEVHIEVFSNTKAYHFNITNWDNLVIPFLEKMPDYKSKPFRNTYNYFPDKLLVEELKKKKPSEIIKEIKSLEGKDKLDINQKRILYNDLDSKEIKKIAKRFINRHN